MIGRDPFDPATTDRIYGGIYGTQAPGILQLASLGAGGPQAAAGPMPPYDPNAPAGPGTPTPTAPTFTILPPTLNPVVPPGPAPVTAPTPTPTVPPGPVPPVIQQPSQQVTMPAGPKSAYGPSYVPTAGGSQVPRPGGPATPGTTAPVTAPMPPSRPAGFGINQPQGRMPNAQARSVPGVVHVQGPDWLKNFFLAGQRSPTGMTAMLNRDRPEGDRGGNR